MLRSLLLLSFIAFSASNVLADSITTGNAGVTGFPAFGRFTFGVSGPGFALNGATSFVVGSSVPSCFPCHAGDTVNIAASTNLMVGSDWLFGSVLTGGTFHNLQAANSFITFDGPSVVIPVSSDPTLTFVGQGGMSGSASSHGIDPFSVTFNGSGLVTMVLVRNLDGSYNFQSLNYVFSTPEPTSIILLCSGLAAVPWIVRKRRRKS